MKFNSSSPFKKCPRCQTKCLKYEKKCHVCGLIFERLNYTSNKSAKKNLLKRKRNEVIMISDWPYDVKKSTSLWLCGLLGWSGAHNFYLGRFLKASLVLFGLLIAIILVILYDLGFESSNRLVYYLRLIGTIPGASVLILWFSDFISIILERYKIPVSIDENLFKIKDEIISNKQNELNKKSKKGTKLNNNIKKWEKD